ncbi:uncharacterized protein LOC119361586 [Triticum dicoccoides]|uniref:uncharacterized protein LOC119361586 n=1 Tax=Triticum dicoccoides TaxID=85692 RepID=UPI00188E216A|nr:uncharacterized protein LOC119361586 [Triticum dicoccoides]
MHVAEKLGKKTEEERTARQREARQRMTPEEKQQSNTLRRAAYQNMSVHDKQETNARRRTRLQNISPKEKQNMLAHRKKRLAARCNTPCAESIAMPRPDADTLATPNLMSSTHALAFRESEASAPAPAPRFASKAGNNFESDGEYLSRTLDDNDAPSELINPSQQTNEHQIDDQQNQAREKRQESRAQHRARERAQKQSIGAKNIQGSALKRRVRGKSIPEGEKSALLDRRNASFQKKRRPPGPDATTTQT